MGHETVYAQVVGEHLHVPFEAVTVVDGDTDTGKVNLLRHVLITDVGTAVNPMIVHGQIHGGAAQGIGQAAMEEVVYDLQSGQKVKAAPH